MRVVHDDCSGEVTTDFGGVSFVGMTGITFNAEIADEHGTHKVNYLVRDGDVDGIENAEWYRFHEGKLVKNDMEES